MSREFSAIASAAPLLMKLEDSSRTNALLPAQNVPDGAVQPAGNAWFSQAIPLLQKTWLRVAFLLCTTFVVHLPSLQGQLIWDDHYLVGENPFFRSPILSLEVFRHYLFLDSASGHYRPVQNLSYMLDYLLWNGDTYGYHFSNTLWHALAGVVLFFLSRRLLIALASGRPANHANTVAFLLALLWVLHPLHSAAVDYISGRADSLAFVFCCSAWLVYLRAASAAGWIKRVAGYTAAALLFLLGLCSREIAVVWAVIFAINLLFFSSRTPRWHRLGALIACLSLLAIYAGLRALPGSRDTQAATSGWGAAARTGLVLRALGEYSRLAVWPADLHMERAVTVERMFRTPATWRDQLAFDSRALIGILAAGVLIVGVFKRGCGRKARVFGTLWFTAGFLPISNVVDLNATAAEHWMYLPLAGLLFVFAGWLAELPRTGFRVAAACTLLAASALGIRSSVRSGDWLTSQVFYERTIAAGGWSPRVGLNLAVIYGTQGRLPEARALLERTLAGWPGYPQAQSYLAVIMGLQGAKDQSDNLLTKAASESPEYKEYPRSWVAALQLANRHVEAQRDEEALRVLAAARAMESKVWRLAQAEAEILRRTRGPEAALEVVEKFAHEHWWQYRAFLALGKLKAQQGDADAARAALAHASRLDIRETQALNLIARIELRAQNLAGAYDVQRRAISRQPDEPSQYVLFSEVLTQMGRADEARRALETAEALQHGRPSV